MNVLDLVFQSFFLIVTVVGAIVAGVGIKDLKAVSDGDTDSIYFFLSIACFINFVLVIYALKEFSACASLVGALSYVWFPGALIRTNEIRLVLKDKDYTSTGDDKEDFELAMAGFVLMLIGAFGGIFFGRVFRIPALLSNKADDSSAVVWKLVTLFGVVAATAGCITSWATNKHGMSNFDDLTVTSVQTALALACATYVAVFPSANVLPAAVFMASHSFVDGFREGLAFRDNKGNDDVENALTGTLLLASGLVVVMVGLTGIGNTASSAVAPADGSKNDNEKGSNVVATVLHALFLVITVAGAITIGVSLKESDYLSKGDRDITRFSITVAVMINAVLLVDSIKAVSSVLGIVFGMGFIWYPDALNWADIIREFVQNGDFRPAGTSKEQAELLLAGYILTLAGTLGGLVVGTLPPKRAFKAGPWEFIALLGVLTTLAGCITAWTFIGNGSSNERTHQYITVLAMLSFAFLLKAAFFPDLAYVLVAIFFSVYTFQFAMGEGLKIRDDANDNEHDAFAGLIVVGAGLIVGSLALAARSLAETEVAK